eukprot:COSAG06_NODE_30161_length_543_cov_1.797297_1_plen_63_part_10
MLDLFDEGFKPRGFKPRDLDELKKIAEQEAPDLEGNEIFPWVLAPLCTHSLLSPLDKVTIFYQ